MQTDLEAPATEPLSSSEDAVAVRGATRRYRTRRGQLTALEGVDLRVRDGEVVAVVGPSGCGKSTLLELIAGLQEADDGFVAAHGHTRADERLAECAYMPQRDLLLPWRDGLANAALALEVQGVGRKEARRLALPLFERFGLAQFERSLPSELSGGMRQRVAFLRTLLAGRPVLLLDEPFAALDALTRGSMQEWLAEALAQEPRTVVLVTHEVEEAIYLSDRVLVLSPRPGRVVAEIPVPLPRPRGRRRGAISDPAFAELRHRALEALEG